MALSKTDEATLNALRSYTRRGPLVTDAEADKYVEESDRGMVVIFGSVTEDLLEERILQNFVELERDRLKQMTRQGVLNSWANKISLALGLGIIDENEAELLEVLKTMRNSCAHSRMNIDFDTPELREVLRILLGEFGPFLDGGANKWAVRSLFIKCCEALWDGIRNVGLDDYSARLHDQISDMIAEAKRDPPPKKQKTSKRGVQSNRKK